MRRTSPNCIARRCDRQVVGAVSLQSPNPPRYRTDTTSQQLPQFGSAIVESSSISLRIVYITPHHRRPSLRPTACQPSSYDMRSQPCGGRHVFRVGAQSAAHPVDAPHRHPSWSHVCVPSTLPNTLSVYTPSVPPFMPRRYMPESSRRNVHVMDSHRDPHPARAPCHRSVEGGFPIPAPTFQNNRKSLEFRCFQAHKQYPRTGCAQLVRRECYEQNTPVSAKQRPRF